jgi:hypothetical protein
MLSIRVVEYMHLLDVASNLQVLKFVILRKYGIACIASCERETMLGRVWWVQVASTCQMLM